MLEITSLTKTYLNQNEAAVDGIDLTVHSGEWVVILGRSGAGKSTLIRCINRLVEPDSGTILWEGKAITGVGNRALRKIRGQIGMIFQQFNLLPRLNVITNVMVGKFADIPIWQCLFTAFTLKHKQLALEALQRVGLDHLATIQVEDLSGGQQQRVAIARVLMQNPGLLLGDEPTSNLDPITAEQILKLISILHIEQKLTILLNLHDVSMARKYATRIIGLSHGKIVFDGPPSQLNDEALQLIYPLENNELSNLGLKKC